MLRNASGLEGFKLHATDGDIGHVESFYFDDESWTVRYLVADTGNWLTGRQVLIANHSVGAADWRERRIFVKLTREQVEHAPGIETSRPVTRRHEADIYDYYGYPYYWAGAGMYPFLQPPSQLLPGAETAAHDGAPPPESAEEAHLQSTRDVGGYRLEAEDGEIGHVKDFIVDDDNWTIRYLEIDTRNWWPGKKVLLAPIWIGAIDWIEGKVCVKLQRQVIRDAPPYDPALPISRDYEISLFDHYGRFLDTRGNFRYWMHPGNAPAAGLPEGGSAALQGGRLEMTVGDVMTGIVQAIAPDCTLQEAAQMMKDWDVGSLPVCEEERLVGMITDRDIAVRAVAAGLGAQATLVREVMTPQVATCAPDQVLGQAARLMEARQIRRLPVLGPDKKLVGIVALADIAVQGGDALLGGEILEGVSEAGR